LISGITTLQSGTPFTVANGADRNNDGQAGDRADIGNPSAPIDSRAVIAPRCSTGYQNPDTSSCVSPGSVHWIEGAGLPNGSTVGRNTLLAGGATNFDLSLSKSFRAGEGKRLEFRWEAQNALNHPQYTQIPQKSVNGTLASRFLNRDFTDSGIRGMWGQVKFIF
jgi:hypothetical protein